MSSVLIVDDEPSFRELLRLFLERAGHEVREAEDGQRALSLYAEQPADLVITDLAMPEMTGLDLMVTMKRTFGAVKTFVISGRGDAELQEAKCLGARAVWPKPFNFDDLLLAVEHEIGPAAIRSAAANYPLPSKCSGSSARYF